jgi:pimeloyl-ACP methyl ester carboxylesterase
MKTKNLLRKIVPLTMLLVLMIIVTISCKKKTEDATVDSNVTGYYELMMQAQLLGEADQYYNMSFTQTNGVVVGDIALNDSGTLVSGIVSGTVNNGLFNLTADLGNNIHSFSFVATLGNGAKPKMITGNVTRASGKSTASSFKANLMAIDDWHCVPNFHVNPHIFQQVSAAANPTGPPVIFVHGMDGSMHNWDTLVMNLSAEFKAKHNVYEYQYNWKDSIIINGRQLKHDVDSAGFSQAPILIAHSMGGLVSRGYIVSGGAITQLVTLGTPHLGTPLVNLINFVCIANFPGPRNMYPSDGYIQYILHHPVDIAARSKYYVIEGRMGGDWVMVQGTNTWVWKETFYASIDKTGFDLFRRLFPLYENDGLVDKSSGLFEGAAVNRPLPLQEWVDHFHLIKPNRVPQVLEYINTL